MRSRRYRNQFVFADLDYIDELEMVPAGSWLSRDIIAQLPRSGMDAKNQSAMTVAGGATGFFGVRTSNSNGSIATKLRVANQKLSM